MAKKAKGLYAKVAQELSDGRYHQRVIQNKKAYDRNKKHKMDSRDS